MDIVRLTQRDLTGFAKFNPDHRWDNMDAEVSAFLNRQLISMRSQALEVQYPQLNWATMVPTRTDVDPGAQVYTYDWWDSFGEAKLITNFADDLPTADTERNEAEQRIYSWGSSYTISVQELRAASFAGNDLEGRKSRAARRTLEQRLDQIMLIGDTFSKLEGLFNLSNTLTYTTPTGASGGTRWLDKTPDEVVKDMNGMVTQVVTNSNNVESPNTMVVPLAAFEDISTRRMGPDTETTILRHFLANQQRITEVMSHWRLDSISNGRVVAYDRDIDKIEGILPVQFEQFAPQQSNLAFKTPVHMRTGGVVALYPKSVIYADNIVTNP